MPLELNPEIYRAVLESLPIGVYLTDRKRQIAFWNTSAERITGYLAQEVIGHCCQDNLLMHCDGNQVALCGSACPLAQTMQDGRDREANMFLRHKDGQRVPVRVRAIPVRDEFGAIVGAAECFEVRSFQATEMRCPHLRGNTSLDDVTQIPDNQTTLSGLGAALGIRRVPGAVWRPFDRHRQPGPFAARLRLPGCKYGIVRGGPDARGRHAAGRPGGALEGAAVRGAGGVPHR